MNLEDLVCAFSQSKRLRELEVYEPSYFGYYEDDHSGYLSDAAPVQQLMEEHFIGKRAGTEHIYNAYASVELGEIISKVFPEKRWYSQKCGDHWSVVYDEGAHSVAYICLNTEAQARAEFLIYLLENKL